MKIEINNSSLPELYQFIEKMIPEQFEQKINEISNKLKTKFIAKGYEEKEIELKIVVDIKSTSRKDFKSDAIIIAVTKHASDNETLYYDRVYDYICRDYSKNTNELGKKAQEIANKLFDEMEESEKSKNIENAKVQLELLKKVIENTETVEIKFVDSWDKKQTTVIKPYSISGPVPGYSYSLKGVIEMILKNIKKYVSVDTDLEKQLLNEQDKRSEIIKQKEIASKQALKDWALQNGSPLLKARIEENMNWKDLANDEYFETIKPEGFEYLECPDKDWPIQNATLELIEELRKVRVNYPDAKLERYKYVTERDREYDDEEDTVEHKNVISIFLKSLDGTHKKFEKVLSTEDVTEEE